MSAYIAIKEIVTLTLHTRTEHKINNIELQTVFCCQNLHDQVALFSVC